MEDASLRYGPVMDSSASSSLSRSFERHLRAKNLSDGTVASYLVGIRQFTAFLQPHGRELIEATRADLEGFVAHLLGRWSPATASTRYKQLQALYRWLEDEEEIAVNLMARMKPPVVPDKPIPVVPEDALRRLLVACAGKSLEARRDTAMITLLIDTGARRGEIAGLQVADLDFDLDVALVLGKGRRERALPFGRTTAVALDRYLRVRARHKDAVLPWLGRKASIGQRVHDADALDVGGPVAPLRGRSDDPQLNQTSELLSRHPGAVGQLLTGQLVHDPHPTGRPNRSRPDPHVQEPVWSGARGVTRL
jgi:integrase